MMTIDTTRSALLLGLFKNMCSHLQRKLFEEDGLWNLLADNRELQKKKK